MIRYAITQTYLFVSDTPALMGWTRPGDTTQKKANARRKAERWFKKRGVAVKRCGRWVVSVELLKVEMPELWDTIASAAYDLVAMERFRR